VTDQPARPEARWSVVVFDDPTLSAHTSADDAMAAAREVSRRRPFAGVCVIDATGGETPPRKRVVAMYVDGVAL
jgi:hypothetical protein